MKDFRPYLRRSSDGSVELALTIKLYPDEHGSFTALATGDHPEQTQAFADPFQGMHMLAGILRAAQYNAKENR